MTETREIAPVFWFGTEEIRNQAGIGSSRVKDFRPDPTAPSFDEPVQVEVPDEAPKDLIPPSSEEVKEIHPSTQSDEMKTETTIHPDLNF